jgi:aspartate ammonia-lyase
MELRTEKDSLGVREIPNNVLYGIHTIRSIENFKLLGYNVPKRLLQSIAMVKKAACQTNNELNYLNPEIASAIGLACDEIINDEIDGLNFPTDAFQGGAGTSTNMNLNEVIANRALELISKEKGEYNTIHPIEHVNMHQSTNDVYPTALKTAGIFALRELSDSISKLQGAFQLKEKEFAKILCIGRTELQDAVPTTLGSIFSTFSEPMSRDRWRTFKSEERLRIVNIGGTAIGTGLTAPRNYIFLVIEKLRQITGLGLSRSEQVMDATANADVFVEVSGMLDAHAVSLSKIAKDLRLLHYFGEISLPAVQAGSSIMPGKINPVIVESVITCSIRVSSNHKIISDCASNGTLQINEFLPMIAYTFLESIDLLIKVNYMFAKHVECITANEEICHRNFSSCEMIITAFLPYIGYDKSETLLKQFQESKNKNFKEYLIDNLGEELVENVLSPDNLISLGYKTITSKL